MGCACRVPAVRSCSDAARSFPRVVQQAWGRVRGLPRPDCHDLIYVAMAWKELAPVTDKQTRDFSRFKKKARFLVDESLGEGVARVLREDGWNAIFVSDVGLVSHSDEDVFAHAWKEDRIVLTHDHDFLDDRCFPPHRNAGVIVLPGASGPARDLV